MLRMTPDNQARAVAGSRAFEAYQRAKGLAGNPSPQSPEETLTDLLSDFGTSPMRQTSTLTRPIEWPKTITNSSLGDR